MKNKKQNRTVKKYVRFTENEIKILRFLACQYCGGNVSKWIRHAALNSKTPRKVLI